MAGLDLSAAMDGIGDALVSGGYVGKVYRWPTDTIQPPCAVVGYPQDPLELGITFQRGADHTVIPVFLICGLASAEATRDVVSDHIKSATAVKTMLDGNLSGAVSSLDCRECTIERVRVGEQYYISLRFDCDVIS